MKKIVLISAMMALIMSFSSPPQIPRDKENAAYPETLKKSGEFSSNYQEGMIVVKFKKGTDLGAFRSFPVYTGIGSVDKLLNEVQASSLTKRFVHKPIPEGSNLPDISRIYRLRFPEIFDPAEVAKMFESDPNVDYAEPEPTMKLYEVPNDPMYGLQQHLPQVFAEQAWDIHKGENGTDEVVIAFIDTGVDWYHEDLTANSWQNLAEDADGDGHTIETDLGGQPVLDPGDMNVIDDDGNGFKDDLVGWDFYEAQQTGNGSDPAPNPGNSVGFHGTHCAGIAAAVTDNGIGVSGISWNCKYMGLMCDINNDLTFAWDGIIYAADNGADVISNSWGGFSWYYDEFATDILDYANGLGSIVVAARGNENDDAFGHPACYPGVIAVASVMTNDVKNAYSSYGLDTDVSAPGGGLLGLILSTEPGNTYNYEAGTSMACPLVSGLLALVKSYHPDWTKDQVINQVIATCDNIDDINPNYAHLLGSGRINAYEALLNEYTLPPQELKMEMLEYSVTDRDDDGILLPGDTGIVSVTLRNYTHGVESDEVVLKLETEDSQVDIFENSKTVTINSDRVFEFQSAFQFVVLPGAESHAIPLNLEISADIPVYIKNPMIIPVVVNPQGFFVYEKYENGRDYSGSFIRQYLEGRGYEVTYSNYFPQSFKGYDAVFLSLGNLVYPLWDPGTFLTKDQTQEIVDYLMAGGKMYAEGGGLFIVPRWLDYSNSEKLEDLFRLSTVSYHEKRPMDTLKGITGTLCEGMKFVSSGQYYNNWIHRLYPAAGAVCPLDMVNYGGKMAIYDDDEGEYGQRTFYFSYSLADVKDENKVSSSCNLMNIVMEALGYSLPEDYLMANFKANVNAGSVNDEVQFTDLSLTGTGDEINSWQWDFQNDGTIDSWDENPQFTYTEDGTYDVKLIVSDGVRIDTIVQENFYTVNEGVFVFEGIEGSREMSGAWIRDFMEIYGYDVNYYNTVPRHIEGYDALFLSFGSIPIASFNTEFEDGFGRMVRAYIKQGGRVFLDGETALSTDQAGPETWMAFGLQKAVNYFPNPNPFDTLLGWPGSICEGLNFYGTNQFCNDFADKYFPNEEGIAAFNQPDFGTLAVQHEGVNGEKTFCMSYALAELQDGESTREELFRAILEYFDMAVGSTEMPVAVNCNVVKVFPNPLKSNAIIEYVINENQQVSVKVYNHLGQLVAIMVNKTQYAGRYQLDINAGDYPSGMYYILIQAGSQTGTGKMIVLK